MQKSFKGIPTRAVLKNPSREAVLNTLLAPAVKVAERAA